ncbi:MAG: hypothetical protein IJ002_08010, partial [Clostridia bacterium]|nr:hypothetical protein [Clostridia bacterium]
MKKKLLSILLVLCMLLSMFPITLPVSAEETDADTETVANTDEVTEIATADALIAIMGDSTKWAGSYKLTADIDLTGLTQSPIGNADVSFTGTFDGDGHTVKGLDITAAGSAGLFGQISGATVKNLTVDGKVTSTGAATGGIAGYIKSSGTIENCVNKVAVSGTARAAGFVGSVDAGTGDILIKNCINEGTITGSSEHIGGIVGRVYGSTAGGSTKIDGCVNKAAVTGTLNVGGIIGRYDIPSMATNGVFNVENCANYAAITATTTSADGSCTGGIIGLYTNNATGATTKINNCLNTGNVSAKAKYVGGIIGYFRSYPAPHPTATDIYVTNCMNTGKIYCPVDSAATAGIIGTGNPKTGGYTVSGNYNSGSVVNNNDTYEAAIIAAISTASVVTNNYALDLGETHGVTSYVTMVTTDNYASAATFNALSADYWIFTDKGPELDTFHEHDLDAKYVAVEGGHATSCYCNDAATIGTTEDHVMVDGTCSVCGAADCTHATTEDVITLAPTCLATGYKNVVCTAGCGGIVEKDVVVEIDKNNHEEGIAISYDADNGCILYTHTCCGVNVYEDWTVGTDIYVATTGTVLDEDTVVIESDIGLSADTAFASLDDAMSYAAAVAETGADAITLHIVDKATLTQNIYTPDGVEFKITGGELAYASNNKVLYAGGKLTVENIKLTASGASYIVAQNNPVVIGEGVTTNSDSTTYKWYLIGGKNTDAVDGTLAGDVTVRSGAWHLITGGNRFSAVASTGTVKMTLGTVNDKDTLTVNQITPFGTNGGNLSADSTSTIIVDGKVDITTLYACMFPNTENGANFIGDAYTYYVDLVLKEGADITTLTAINNVAASATAVWTVYADQRNENAVADAALFAGNGSNITVTQSTYAVYCVNKLDGHVDANEDKLCDECGSSTDCNHVNVTTKTVTASTCSTQGTANVVCLDCGATVGTETLALDENNHENTNYVWSENAETGAYEVLCSGCGAALVSQTDAPTVYVAKYDAGVTSGSDANDGLTSASGVATLEEAVKRLAKTGGTVLLTSRFDLNGARINLPAYEKKITFSGVVDANGNATTGFINTGSEGRLFLAGPTEFNNIVFKGKACNVIVGGWNDLDFGYVRVHDEANIFVIAGNYLTTESDSAEKDITINLDGATMSTSSSSASGTSETVFYNRIYLGDVFGANNLTVSNKKVTLNVEKGKHHEAALNILYAASTTGNKNYAASTTENCETVVNLYDATTLPTGRIGDHNMGYSYSGGSFDKYTLNLNDNSTITGDYHIKNTKETVVNISTEADGRTTKIAKQFITMKYGTFATDDVAATLTVNVDSHSYSNTTLARQATVDAHVTAYTITLNETNVCTWDDGKITTEATPDAAGVKTYTCSGCGATKTEEVEFVCTEHAYVVKADGTYYCTNKCEDVEAPSADVIISASPAT